MIDTLECVLDFDSSLVEIREDGKYAFVGMDLHELNINLSARHVYLNFDGELRATELFHPYESLPTSFTGMACKVFLNGHFFPHVKIKCSVAKIMQGHNVFGTENLEYCLIEMLYWLRESYPVLYGMLSIQTMKISRIDITYMSYIQNEKLVRQAIDFLSRVSNGQTKATKNKKYETTAYWGGETSRLVRLKCYAKYDEYMAQFEEYKKLVQKGDAHALKIVQAMSDERIIDFARKSLRWECTLLKRYLERNDIPVNAWELVERQKNEPDVFQKLWLKGFGKVFEAVQGQEMKIVNDDDVISKLKAHFYTVTATGKVSYRKANNLYDFYRSLKLDGYQVVKTNGRYSISRFNELVADLVSVGFSKGFLQNLTGSDNVEIIPMIELIKVDFSRQSPDWWVEQLPTPMRLASNDSFSDVA